MKKSIMFLVMALSVIVSSCDCPSEQSSRTNSETTSKKVQTTEQTSTRGREVITAKVIRVGRYLTRNFEASESGTVLIFENGDVFKMKDTPGSSFACAVKEGDVVTYERSFDGKINLKAFVPQD